MFYDNIDNEVILTYVFFMILMTLWHLCYFWCHWRML